MLTVFGLGLGWHLDALLDSLDVLHLVVYEPSPDLFHASLFAIDWDAIVKRFRGAGRSLTVVVEPDPEAAVSKIFASLQSPFPALVVGSRYFRLYDSPVINAVIDTVTKHLPLLGYGWGYFKDERRQVLQTWQNLNERRRWIAREWPRLADADAMVVGGGPSLDRTLPLLKSIRERVVIFSGGSAIQALSAAGIEPDFHVELETAPITAEILGRLPDPTLLQRIPVLVSSGMSPVTLALFRTAYFFCRDSSVSSDLMKSEVKAVPGCYPVVGNAAVGVATALGFRRITLLGVDFGYRDPKRHHAAGTVYIDERTGEERADLAEIYLNTPLRDYGDVRAKLVSTLGDELLVDETLLMSHTGLDIFIGSVPDLTLIQCGEGARLGRAINITPAEFDASRYRAQRSAVMTELASRIEEVSLSQESYGKRMTALADAVRRLAGRIKQLFADPCTSPTDFARRSGLVLSSMQQAAQSTPGVSGLLFGAFTSYFKATIERSFMTESEEDQRRFLLVAQQQFVSLLDDFCAAVEVLRVE
jgi:hypothetical protein